MSEEKQHKRRVHYSGKYPKKFEEKYKELNPEKYKDTIEHVISKGNTPAGMHISIMVKEIIDFLDIKPGQTGFDATLGYGGHTKAMLEKLDGQGHMYATDVDPIESEKTKKRLAEAGFGEDILTIKLQNFCTIDEIAKEVGGFDFILADLGVSSMQIDNPERGFSFKVDGPLDLRLNPNAGISAAERLDNISREELSGMLYENSDEPYCEELAKAITDEIRKGNRIDTTTKLRHIIEQTLDFLPEKDKRDIVKKTCQRTFQALRIDVNHEFEVLYEFMEKLPGALKPGGRAAILTFHSGEDKLVKKALKAGYKAGIYSDYSKDVIPLCPYDSCRLLAINLYEYVKNPFTAEAYFDFELFRQHVQLAQRIMDDIIDLEAEKIEKILNKIDADPESMEIKQAERHTGKKQLSCRRTGGKYSGIPVFRKTAWL